MRIASILDENKLLLIWEESKIIEMMESTRILWIPETPEARSHWTAASNSQLDGYPL